MSDSTEDRRRLLGHIATFLGAAAIMPTVSATARAGPFGGIWAGRRLFGGGRRVYRYPARRYYTAPQYVRPPAYGPYYRPAQPYYRPAPPGYRPGFRPAPPILNGRPGVGPIMMDRSSVSFDPLRLLKS